MTFVCSFPLSCVSGWWLLGCTLPVSWSLDSELCQQRKEKDLLGSESSGEKYVFKIRRLWQDAFLLDYHGLLDLCAVVNLWLNIPFHRYMSGSLATKGAKLWMLCPPDVRKEKKNHSGNSESGSLECSWLLDNLHTSIVQMDERTHGGSLPGVTLSLGSSGNKTWLENIQCLSIYILEKLLNLSGPQFLHQ